MLGGPLYQLLLRLRLARPPLGFVERRIAIAIAITWLPVLLLAWAGGTALGGTKVPFFYDVDTHVRLLVALPLLIGAEPLVHAQLATQVRQFIERGIIAPPERARFAAIIDDTMRLRNSMAIELVLLACAIGVGFWVWREQFASRAGTWYMAEDRLTAAGAWYGFVSLGLFRFVLFRWYFRIVLWYLFLARVSRMPLQLNALHPDRAGGIGFLAGSLTAFAPVLLAQSATIAGILGGQILFEGAKLAAFRLEIGVTVALLVALPLLPLAFFVAPLLRAGLQGRLEYGVLAMHYVAEFREKWLRGAAQKEPLAGSNDIQSLADLAHASEVVSQIGVLPVNLKALVRFAVLIALPFAPLVLTVIPLNELISRVLKQVI
ncbi:MAG TPA: hypothetical protein VFJ70_06280 [Burkholderiales bacterium]|nr:hypothetical protein [Burkholderiales bacterium]